jgi:hypothetical protein
MADLHTVVAPGTATQPQRLLVGEGETVDAMQASGAWLASDTSIEVRR